MKNDSLLELNAHANLDEAYLSTPIGLAHLLGNDLGLQAVKIIDVGKASKEIPITLQAAAQQLTEYFEGKRTAFDLQIAPRGTAFQRQVWQSLLKISYGTTWSYRELAAQVGDPAAVRAVAAANGKNPLWIIVPCHRVIGSDGSLTGYAGGLFRKQWLLNLESATPQQSLFD
ncbi:MAG: hypothetical protein RLZZ241_15 [Bacteroidota bacterium]|jgi:methylated-DNA-[protein]-cysteine S-methyltransferase